MKTITLLSAALFIVIGAAVAKPIPPTQIQKSKITTIKPADVFGTFHVHRQGDFAALNWEALSEEATSFIIQRSYDGEFFNDVAEVTPDVTHWNRYIDNTVEPGLIYYRIVAYSNGVTIETSSTELVKIVKHK